MVALHPGAGVCRLLYVWTSRMREIDTEIGRSSGRAERCPIMIRRTMFLVIYQGFAIKTLLNRFSMINMKVCRPLCPITRTHIQARTYTITYNSLLHY